MRTRVALSLVALLSLLGLFLLRETSVPASKATSIEQVMKTTLVVLAEDGQASCSPIGGGFGCTAWLTCAHVVDALPQSILLADGTTVPVIASLKHPTRDVGLIWTTAQNVWQIPLADQDAKSGSQAVHAGFPVHLGLWIAAGFIGSPDADGDVWTSVPAFYGCSGGPVIVDGRVAGVVRGIYTGSSGPFTIPIGTMSCIVPVDSFRDWLAESLSRDPRAK